MNYPYFPIGTEVYALLGIEKGVFTFQEGVVVDSDPGNSISDVEFEANGAVVSFFNHDLHRRYHVLNRVRMLLPNGMPLESTVTAIYERPDGIPVYRLQPDITPLLFDIDLLESDTVLEPL